MPVHQNPHIFPKVKEKSKSSLGLFQPRSDETLSWHIYLPASLSAELWRSPLSLASLCPSTRDLRTAFLSVWKPCQPQSYQRFWDHGPLSHAPKQPSGSAACGCPQNDICHHTESQSFQIPSSDIYTGCLSPILLCKLGARWFIRLGSLLSGQAERWTVGP